MNDPYEKEYSSETESTSDSSYDRESSSNSSDQLSMMIARLPSTTRQAQRSTSHDRRETRSGRCFSANYDIVNNA